MFRSFSVYNYRVWFIGALVSNVGAWMQATALSWVVLTQLTDNDAAAMGVTMALQFAPPLLLVGVTGWVADRFDRFFATPHGLDVAQAAQALGMDAQSVDVDAPEASAAVAAFLAAGRPGLLQLRLPQVRA